jgi:hypothetical protein
MKSIRKLISKSEKKDDDVIDKETDEQSDEMDEDDKKKIGEEKALSLKKARQTRKIISKSSRLEEDRRDNRDEDRRDNREMKIDETTEMMKINDETTEMKIDLRMSQSIRSSATKKTDGEGAAEELDTQMPTKRSTGRRHSYIEEQN